MKDKEKGLSSYTLKIIAVITMTIDHTGQLIPSMPFFLRMIGRLSAPLFFFTLAYSFQNTTSRRRFLFRIYVASIVMELTKIIAFFIDSRTKHIVPNNIFGTMCIAVLLAICLESILVFFRARNFPVVLCYLAIVIIVIVWSFVTLELPETVLWLIRAVAPSIQQVEGGVSLVVLLTGMCLFATKKRSLIIFYSGYCLLELIGTIVEAGFHTLLYNIQWMMIFAIPLFIMYNGERGKSRKWFFYVYYPSHIWILYMIGSLL